MFHDLLGIYDGHAPRFAKRYAEPAVMVAGVAEYAAEVRGTVSRPRSTTRSTRTSWTIHGAGLG